MNARKIFAGSGGGAMPGDIRSSYAGDAYMLSEGFYPLAGGIVNQADNPVLFNSIKHKNYFLNQTLLGTFQFQENNYYQYAFIGYDGDDTALIAVQDSGSSYYYHAITLSTGNRPAASVYVDGGSGSYAHRVVRWTGSAFYIGNAYGRVYRIAPGSLGTKAMMFGGQFTYSSFPHIMDILELNGYVYVATGEGIWRALLSSNLTVPGSWTKVYTYSYFNDPSYLFNETVPCNFFYDSVSGTIFFTHIAGHGCRSTNGGSTWVNMPIPSNRSKIVRWGNALFMFERGNGAGGASIVTKSTDNGVTWTTAALRLVTTAKTMHPIVRNNILYYSLNNGLYALFSEQPGLQDPAIVDHRFSNVVYLGAFSGQVVLPANDAVGFRSLNGYLNSAAGTQGSGWYFTPGYDMATQFRLPTQAHINNIPQYLKAG